VHAGVEFRKARSRRRDDDPVQGKLLPHLLVHAKQAGKVGSEGVVFGRLQIQVCLQFRNYCRKNANGLEGQAPAHVGEGNMARNLVLGLMEGLEGQGHVLITDNYFSSIGLFITLANRDIYATGTVRANRVGLPSNLKNLRNWNRSV
jgi:hypothetical protein